MSDVLEYGATLRRPGLTLLSGPGNDPVSITALASCGCQLLVFTTGRGNPPGDNYTHGEGILQYPPGAAQA